MAIDYDEIADGALEAIEEAGQAVTLNIPGSGGGYIPGQGVVPANPATTAEGIGVLLDYKQHEIDGTTIMHGDQKLLLAPQIAVVPTTTHTVTAMHLGVSKTFTVKNVGAVAPAGVPVLYILQLRGV